MNLLELSHVNKIYHTGFSETYALKDVSFSVRQGEFTVILGPSGAGKSTILNILGGIDTADGGTVTVSGQEITNLGEKELSRYRAEKVGFVFQFYNLIPTLTVSENVDLMRELKQEAVPAEEALKRVGLQGHEHKFPDQLSGGEQQRVSIARAIAKNPDILLCDEPTGALDSETGCLVLEQLWRLCREDKKTTLIVTHNAGIAQAADKVIHVKNGEITDIRMNPSPLKISEVEW